jgi:hypothetical protein
MKTLDVVSQMLQNSAEYFYLPRLPSCFYLTATFARGTHIFEQLRGRLHKSLSVTVEFVH